MFACFVGTQTTMNGLSCNEHNFELIELVQNFGPWVVKETKWITETVKKNLFCKTQYAIHRTLIRNHHIHLIIEKHVGYYY